MPQTALLPQRAAVRHPLRLVCAFTLLVAGVLVVAPAQAAHAGGPPAGGGELVIINSVKVGNPLTTEQCNQSKNDPVIPTTVDATFITAGSVKPTGPYAVSSWSGGTGTTDMHFGTGEGHSNHQVFHLLEHPVAPTYYHGPGDYDFNVIVQDVGLAGGFATKSVSAHLGAESSFGAGLHMKCPILGDLDKPSDFADAALAPFISKFQSILTGAIENAASQLCSLCVNAYDTYQEASSLFSTVSAYNNTVDSVLNNVALKDPPDPDYQELATPQPAPVLAPPADFSATRQDAVRTLYTRLAAVIGDGRAMLATINRIWGAGNAGDRYWYRRQLNNLATIAGQTSTDLDAIDAAYSAFEDAFADTLAPAPLSADAASDEFAGLSASGLPAAQQNTLRTLGNSPADIAGIADYLSTGDENAIIGQDASQALLAEPVDYGQSAGDFDNLQAYATSAANSPAPVVTGLDARHAPTTGGTTLTLHGTNLASVTGVNFGPSTPTSGQGKNVGCAATWCTVTVPPGTGTVAVVAIGPGGPSETSPDLSLTYDQPTAPTVSSVVPGAGSTSGGTQVQVQGAGLAGGSVYFGPVLADSSVCSATVCSAPAPQSAHEGRVDVTVVSADGTRSTAGAADGFTYAAAPAPPAAPVVTALSAHTGSDLGGDSITITGTGLSGATGVRFGGVDAEDFTVHSDTSIIATAPNLQGDGTVDVTVLGPGGTSSTGSATRWAPVAQTPTVTSVDPTSAASTGGTTITVHGTGLQHGTVLVDGDYLYDSSCTPTVCSVAVPPHAPGAVQVAVNSFDGTSADGSTSAFTYTAGALPVITRISPDHGSTAGYSPIAITGTGLAGGTVAIDGSPARFDDVCSATFCLVYPAPHDAGQVDVVITTATGTSATATYSYDLPGPPTVTSVYPRSGGATGITSVTVFGTDLRDGEIHVGDIDAGGGPTQQLCDDTSCSVLIQGDGTTGLRDITVSTSGGTSPVTAKDRFTLTRPTITSVSPSSGWTLGGQQVVVTGTGLADGTIAFGGVDFASPACESDTRCTVTVPAGSAAGAVDVTAYSADGQTTSAPVSADTFTYRTLGTPRVTAISPSTGTDGGGDTVTVAGINLYQGSVSFGGATASNVACTDTACTATAPASGSGDGPVDVTVTTPVATSATAGADRYTYARPGVPTISAIAPTTGSAAGGTPFVLTGTGLTRGSITIGNTSATNVACTSASRCTGITPPGTVGSAAVGVVTDGGAAGGSPFTYTRPDAPTITGVTPARGPASGGSVVTVTGTNLGAASIGFGTTAGTGPQCSDTGCTVLQPAGTPGAHDITATTAGGTATADEPFTDTAVSVASVDVTDIDNDDAGGGHVIAAADGTVWFTMPPLGRIGHVGTNGAVTTFAAQAADSTVIGVAVTGDGRIWYTESGPNTIVSTHPDGTDPTEYPIPGGSGDLRDLVVGSDGKLWFTLGVSGALGVLDPSNGAVRTYPLPDPGSYPVNLIAGPDGRIWFTEAYGGAIGAITTSGRISEYPVPDAGSQPWALTSGPDGRVWFTERSAPTVGAVTVTGQITRYGLPTTDGPPVGITTGVDGRLWVTENGFDQLTALDPTTGASEDVPFPTADNVSPRYLATAADGSIWVSEYNGSELAHVTGVANGVTPAVGAVTPGSAAVGGGTTVTVTGANLVGATAVLFGGTSAPATVIDATHLSAVAPPHAAGSVGLAVVTPHRTTATVPFRYGAAPAVPTVTAVSPDSGSTAGGTAVTVTGSGLTGATLAFGGAAASGVSCTDSACTATSPAGPVGSVHVVATTAGGSNAATDADRFAYHDPAPGAPVVTGVNPTSGSAAGGTTVTVTGTGLSGGIVDVGADPATAVTCTATSCTATTPPGNGTAHVTVQTAGGTSARGDADRFGYRGAPASVVPGVPARPAAVAGSGRATVSFSAPSSDGGSAVLDYRVTAYTGSSVVATQTVSSGGALEATFSGLRNGTAYTFSVAARNAVGLGSASPVSSATVPRLPVTAVLTSPPRSAAYGLAVPVRGVVRSGSSGAGGCVVAVQLRRAGSGAWAALGRAARSASNGVVAWSVSVPSSGQLRLVVAAGVCTAASSPATSISVRVRLTAALSARTVRHGRTVRATGVVAPVLGGRRVYLQQLVGRSWKVVTSTTLTSRSAYAFVIRPQKRGTATYRVLLPASTAFTATTSAQLVLRAT